MAKFAKPNTAPERPMADGFINMRIVDKNGGLHSFKVGIPLFSDRKLDKMLLENPELLTNALNENRIQFSIWINGSDDSTIDL